MGAVKTQSLVSNRRIGLAEAGDGNQQCERRVVSVRRPSFKCAEVPDALAGASNLG